LQGVVSRDDEACKVSEELAAEVEDDEEEVESGQSNGSVGFGHARLLLYVVQGGVLGKLRKLVSIGRSSEEGSSGMLGFTSLSMLAR
jgi:hypothetical protein